VQINRLIVGDCMEVIREFPDAYFDACITDPPYGVSAYKGDSKCMALIFPDILPGGYHPAGVREPRTAVCRNRHRGELDRGKRKAAR
jgi:tRNA G10  N-methylase Trm11